MCKYWVIIKNNIHRYDTNIFIFHYRKRKRNMLCIVYDVRWKWAQILKTSFALKNTKRKTSCKYMTTSHFIQKTKPNCLKVDLAIAKKLPNYRRYHNIFDEKKIDFFSLSRKPITSRMSIVQIKHCHWRSSYCPDMSKHVHFGWSFLPSGILSFYFIANTIYKIYRT